MRRRGTLLAALAVALAGALPGRNAEAAPAAWYIWESKVSERRICAQVSPGPGWSRAAGPYRDGACLRPR